MTQSYPVVVGICLDAEAIWVGKAPENENRPVLLSHGAFAVREGLGPLLDVLDEHGVRATFYVPGMTADRYPDAVKLCATRGHEVASHGYKHLPVHTLTAEQEEHELVAGLDALERITGARPATWRSPSWEFSPRTMDLMLKYGIRASANYFDALRPYRHMRDGKALPIVELPVQWHLADAPYFLYGGQIGRIIRPATDAEKVWTEEFDALYETPGTFYHLTLHVQLIGHPGRLRMLARHLRHVRGQPGVTFLTAQQAAALVP
jgi:peptidoglycan/xylan/chitin deacetylase (PgdA/CDA1 family)